MKKPLLGLKIAVLVANGFAEKDLTFTQKAIMGSGAHLRIISMDQGLVNSWSGDGWGLNFAADAMLSRALAADFDMLIVPGGQRGVEKLEMTAHTRRFIGGFVDAGKPVALFEDAVALLTFAERAAGVTVCGPDTVRARLEAAGANWEESAQATHENIMTGRSTDDTRQGYAEAVVQFMMQRAVADAQGAQQQAA